MALACAGILLIFDLLWLSTLHYRVPLADFFVYYLAAQTGAAHGWSSMYDPSTFLPTVTIDVGRPLPYLNPPQLAWLVVPLSWLPYGIAAAVWGLLLLAAMALTWYLAAPGTHQLKLIHLLAIATLLPVFVSVLIGQVSLVIVVLVALAWWLIERDRPWLAGATLGLIALKPQLAFLVPIALLIAGYWRVFLGWLAVTGVFLISALLAVGPSIVHQVTESLARVHGIPGPVQMSLERQLPVPVAAVGMVIVAAIALVIIRRWNGAGSSIPIAIGLLSSMLLSPYINFYDLSAPVLAAWLVLRTSPPRWQQLSIAALYLPLYLAPIWPLLTLGALCAWLGSLVFVRPSDQADRRVAGTLAA